MKSHLLTVVSSCVLVLIVTSCKKQLATEKNDVASVSMSSTNSVCKVVGIGLATRQNVGGTSWDNLLLKWYDNSGQLKNVKFALDNYSGTVNRNFLAVEYGEITYTNDEVHLRDVFYNQEILKVKLDVLKRPMISWYNSYGRTADIQYDTSYYSYSPDNRLESITRHMRLPGADFTGVSTWGFSYDPAGNLVTINPVGYPGGFEYHYDYTRLNQGKATLEIFSAPAKALEFMDLLKFEHHHEVSYVIFYETSGYPSRAWGSDNIQRDSQGKVISYNDNGSHTWYTAWDCNGSSMLQSRNPSQKEFMRLVH